MSRIKIKDLNVSLEELKKRDPLILKKIMGGTLTTSLTSAVMSGASGFVRTPTLIGRTSLGNPLGPFSQSLSNLDDNG
jgi:hypothetical protein